MTRRLVALRGAAGFIVSGFVLAGCAAESGDDSTTGDSEVTLTNCGAEVTFPSPAERMFVTGDGNLLALALALGAEDQIAGVTGLQDSGEALSTAYGADVVEGLHQVSKDYPTMENVLAQQPDVMLAGWGYGYKEEDHITPEGLKEHDVAPYVLSESCRQADGDGGGTMPPWKALTADLENLGEITDREGQADEVIADIEERRTALEEAPQAQEAPTVFLVSKGSKQVFTSGSFGAPQAIIEAAGAKNATEDVEDTWTEVSWERLVKSEPDFFVFSDYAGMTFEQKVTMLETNPATKDLPAVKEDRYLNLPTTAWTSGPLNIDAAEQLRTSLEEHDLVPASDIEPEHDLEPASGSGR
ncbi:MAG: ABC transporter substrate-binding protein [Janibacter sp.]